MNKTKLDSAAIAELASQMGANSNTKPGNSNVSRLPQLVINSQVDDDDGNSLPRGHFTIKGVDTNAFAETVTFRPLSHHFQYLEWDNVNNRMSCKSKIISNFGEEPIDTRGTVRCGKPISSQLRDMAPEQKEKFAGITCFRQVRGLVSGTAKTATGDEVTWDNIPVILMLKGTNFNPFDDEYLKVIPKGRNIWDFQAKLSSKRHKNGSVTWFTFQFAPDLKNPLGLDEKVVETIKVIAESIKSENARVKKAYDLALSNQQMDQQAIDALNNSLDDDLDDGLDQVA
jgi:hypothetical protein